MARSNNTQLILTALQAQLAEHVVVAVSGGMDSHVLLHALATYFPSVSVEAVHVNHQQSNNAKAWEAHTESVCVALNVPYHCSRVNPVIKPGDSVEACLRDARFAALNSYICGENSVLFLAHHADDQVETVLLRLLRGSGPTGLGAMSVSSGKLRRPLLGLTREQLGVYADEHALEWVEDESNKNEKFDRNYLRQRVMPLLKERWSGLCKTIPRTAQLCQESDGLLSGVAVTDGITADNPLNWQPLQNLPVERQRNAIRCWLLGLQVLTPTQAQLNGFLQQMKVAASDKVPSLSLRNNVIRYYKNHLYYCSKKPIGRLVTRDVVGGGLSKNKVLLPLTTATRCGGERIKIGNSNCHQSLKNCWQQWGVPPWLRDYYPLVYQGGELIAVPGYAYASDFAAGPGEAGLVVEWQTNLYDDSSNLVGEKP